MQCIIERLYEAGGEVRCRNAMAKSSGRRGGKKYIYTYISFINISSLFCREFRALFTNIDH